MDVIGEPDNDHYLVNFDLVCKFCDEKLTDYHIATIHLRSYHLEAYHHWRSGSLPLKGNNQSEELQSGTT